MTAETDLDSALAAVKRWHEYGSPPSGTYQRWVAALGTEVERLRSWQYRAASVLPLIERHQGTDLAIEVNWLLSHERPATDMGPTP